jgi:hypothetical protein
MADVTIYNDDPHGRAIKLVVMNPFAATISEIKILESGGNSGNNESHSVKVRNGEMLIITTAEKDSAAMPASGGTAGGGGAQCKRSPLSCMLPDGHRGDCKNMDGGVTGGAAGAPIGSADDAAGERHGD